MGLDPLFASLQRAADVFRKVKALIFFVFTSTTAAMSLVFRPIGIGALHRACDAAVPGACTLVRDG